MPIYKSINVNQVSYGEAIGIILLKTVTPAIPGDVANAITYSYPVRYKVIEEASIDLMFTNPKKILNKFIEAGRQLERDGVKAITGDCGFMAVFQKEMINAINVPVFMSSLLQIPIILRILKGNQKIGVITANAGALNEKYFDGISVIKEEIARLIIGGMENNKAFKRNFLEGRKEFNSDSIEKEVVSLAIKMISDNNEIGAFLMECSVLPPYSVAVQRATRLPVFDYVTLIDYVHSAVAKTHLVFYDVREK